jgi:CubicO group peptidase (beta-lactamase class C family)
MSAPSRALPQRPSLRYLKLEAKRRVCSGEWPALHDAQLAIAREHGLPSWTALKRLVAEPQTECHALTHLRWLISRFADADRPGWTAPAEAEFREHFADRFLTRTPAERLATVVAGYAADLRADVSLTPVTPLMAVAGIEGLHVVAMTEAAPPHRLTTLETIPLGSRITDIRVADPATRTAGEVPEHVARVAERALTRLGLPGLVAAGLHERRHGAAGGDGSWALARGWADLDTREALDPDQVFPAAAVTTLVTAVALLRLVADGRVGLADPASRHLRSIRLADEGVTLGELLTHTSGVPTPNELIAPRVPPLEDQCGPVLAVGTDRGSFRFSLGGYAAVGQVIADVTGSPYTEAVGRLVLEPLGMASSSFPDAPPGGAAAGYAVTRDGSFQATAPGVCTLTAAAGLWTTAPDLVRFCLGWPSLLPPPLAREALAPRVSRAPHPGHVGLGWLIAPDGDLAGCAGATPGSCVSVLIRSSDGAAQVTMTNRQIPIEPVGVAALGATGESR